MYFSGIDDVCPVEAALLGDMIRVHRMLDGDDTRSSNDPIGFGDWGASQSFLGGLTVTVFKAAEIYNGAIYNIFFNLGSDPSQTALQDGFVVMEKRDEGLVTFSRVDNREGLKSYFQMAYDMEFTPLKDTRVI